MKVVIVCDSFKESLSSSAVAEEIEAGFRTVFPALDCISLPVADGGEGTVDALVHATAGQFRFHDVTGPMGAPVWARYGVLGDGRTAVIEMAAAAGLDLVPRAVRDPRIATTFGLGQLILHALDGGCRRFILGLGGSATNDGGAGMAQALGVRLLDANGQDLPRGGAALQALATIDTSALDPRLGESVFEIACDVDNPMTGEHGASAVFGPQKGATPEMVALLDAALVRFGEALERISGVGIMTVPGAGAAGGLGAGASVFLGARLRPGVEIVLDALALETVLAGADLVITGEGRLDGQTARGKTPVGVARVARRQGVPVIALVGALGPGYEAVYDHGINAVFSVVNRPCLLEEALADARPNIRGTARNIAALLALAPMKASSPA
ncbi:glycerate kinase [Acetobacter peroxydans]|uniref:glycerate kinase n=1 Tax=Acetobacter peroxydans TaxID=104098 RepID=UPI0023579553|nr:glycerate kinase [Acetobacter peroxydans]MCH4143214.1 glycerate kinase [Acetobacter peroxydans]MCI1411681.1 glycerate kinase [Acetobacter peroxydans]MCI1566999.1 glycerate kinase [Acetobacter peroxydans]MCI1724950.1 glycerate kinase [Acetobacter peroxydans]MCI1766975.1 glycerate kinase [Acetobacter peroxydans]